MQLAVRLFAGLACVMSLSFAACSERPEAHATADRPCPPMTRAATYVDTTAEFPRLRFEDGSVSLNDRCPVRRVRLNRRMPPVFVNGHPVGFC